MEAAWEHFEASAKKGTGRLRHHVNTGVDTGVVAVLSELNTLEEDRIICWSSRFWQELNSRLQDPLQQLENSLTQNKSDSSIGEDMDLPVFMIIKNPVQKHLLWQTFMCVKLHFCSKNNKI